MSRYGKPEEIAAAAPAGDEAQQPISGECLDTGETAVEPVEAEPAASIARRRTDKRSEAERQAQEEAAAKLAAVIETMLLGKSYNGYEQLDEPQYQTAPAPAAAAAPAPARAAAAAPTPAPAPHAVAPAPTEAPLVAPLAPVLETAAAPAPPRMRQANRVLILVILMLILPGIFIASSLSREDTPNRQTVAMPDPAAPKLDGATDRRDRNLR